MSVLIKGMEMPQSCFKCKFYDDDNNFCHVGNGYSYSLFRENLPRPEFCPLVEVQTPHGRLVDMDAFEKDLAQNVYDNKRKTTSYPTVVSNTILKTPTIIEQED